MVSYEIQGVANQEELVMLQRLFKRGGKRSGAGTQLGREFKVGDVIYGVPWHICPTVALHNEVQVVRSGRVVQQWQVTARARTLTI